MKKANATYFCVQILCQNIMNSSHFIFGKIKYYEDIMIDHQVGKWLHQEVLLLLVTHTEERLTNNIFNIKRLG